MKNNLHSRFAHAQFTHCFRLMLPVMLCLTCILSMMPGYAQSWRCLYPQEFANDGSFSRGCADTSVFFTDLLMCDTVIQSYRGYYFLDENPADVYPSGSWTGSDHTTGGNTNLLLTAIIAGTQGVKAWEQNILASSGSAYSFSAFGLNPDSVNQYGNPQIYLLARTSSTLDTISSLVINGNGKWHFIEGIFTASAQDSVAFEIHINGAGTGWIYTGIDDISIREVNTGFTNPQVVSFDTTSQPGYVILGATPGFSSYQWFNNLDSSYFTVDTLFQALRTLDLLYFYVQATNSDGCTGTSGVEALVDIRNVPRCTDDCYIPIPILHETFPNHEACNSQASLSFGSDHTFCDQNINGANCIAYTHVQQLNPPIPDGLFYVVNNANNVKNTWNRADASTPSDALLIGDPWDPNATRTWYMDVNLVVDSIYCLSAMVANVLENQETGFLPVASLRVSDDSQNNFPWPGSFTTVSTALALPYSLGWRTLQGSFRATVSGMHRIAIVNNATVNTNNQGGGRDLGVDEITLSRLDFQPPTASISGHQTICPGSTAQLTFTLGGNSGPWNIAYSDGTTNTVITGISSSPYIISVSPTLNTTYTLYLVAVGLCSTQTASSAVVTVLPSFNAYFSPDQTICVGNATTQSIHFTGSGPWDVSYSDGTTTTVLTGITATPYVFGLTPTQTTTYTLNYVIMNGCTTQVNLSREIMVIPYPSASMSASQTVCAGVGTDLTVNLTGVGPWEIEYSDGIGNTVITGITSSPYIVSVTPGFSSTYTLNYVVTSGCTTQIGNTIVIDGIYIDYSMPGGGGTLHICENDSAQIGIQMTGAGPWDLHYTDGTNNLVITGITSSPYSFWVYPTHSTVYTVNFITMGSCTTYVNQTYTVIVHPRPTGTLSGNQTICLGATATLTFTLNGSGTAFIHYTDGTTSYSQSGLSPFTISVSPTQTTTYTLFSIFQNCNTSATSPPVVVTVVAADANISGTQTICAGSTANLSIDLGTGSSGPWDISYSDGTNTIVVTGISASPYVFTVTPSHTTTYTLNTVITVGCTTQINRSVVVTIYEPGAAVITQPHAICLGQSTSVQINLFGIAPWDLTYTDGTNNFQISGISTSPYNLIVSPTQTTTYTLTSVTTEACTAYMQLNNSSVITVLPLPSGSISSDQTICPGASTNLSFHMGGGSGPWDISYSDGTNNTIVTGISASPYVITITPTHNVTYTFNHTVMNGCSTQVNTNTVISLQPPATGNISGDQTICVGNSAELTLTLGGSNGPWDFEYSDGTNSIVITGISAQPYIFNVTPNQAPTTYTLNYIVTEGCTTQIGNGSTISWHPPSTATISGNQTICDGNTAQLSFNLTGTPPWDITWTDGTTSFTVTGITSTNYVVTVTPTLNTTYTLTSLTDICSTQTLNQSVVVSVTPVPVASLHAVHHEVCEGQVFPPPVYLTGTGPWDLTFTDGTNPPTTTSTTASPYLHQITATLGLTMITITPSYLGCAGTPVFWTFTVHPTSLFNSISANQTICIGQSASFSLSYSGTGPLSFIYSDGVQSGLIATGINTNPYIWTPTPTSNTTYTVTSWGNAICGNLVTSNNTVSVDVIPILASSFTGPQFLCAGQNAQLSLNLTGNAPWAFEYTDGTSNFQLTGITSNPYVFSVTPTQSTTYTIVQVSNPDCSNAVSLPHAIYLQALPSPTLSGNLITCPGSSTTLSVSLTPGSGPWDFNYTDGTTAQTVTGVTSMPWLVTVTPTANTTFTITQITDGVGCTNGPFDYVMGHLSPVPFTPHGNVYLCVSAVNPPSDPILGMNYPVSNTYLWSTGATTSTIQVSGSNSTSYSVIISDPATGCSETDIIWILHANPPTFSLNQSFDCQTDCYSLQLSSSDPNGNTHSYNWNLTDQNFDPLNVTGTSQTICYGNNNGQFPYTITATNTQGCSSSLAGILHYTPLLNITQKGILICPIPKSDIIGSPDFAILASMSYAFSWTGPNGFTANSANPYITHDPGNGLNAVGVYTVAISHASGCSTTYEIGVLACCQTDPNVMVLRNGAVIVPSTVPNNATIVIDGDVTIQGQVSWQGVNAFLRPQARIIIPSPTPAQDHRLWMESTHLRSDCGDTVWYGIDVNGTLALSGTIKHGLVVRKNSIIEDAYNAVRSIDAGFFMLQDAVLDNNYFHVNIRPFDGLNVAQPFETHPGIWDNAQMLCSRPILTIPAGPGWLNPTTAINGRRTYACIRGTNNSGLSGRGIAVNGSYSQNFSPPIASNNQGSLFDNADYGIDIQAIDLDIRDARFQNIYCNSGFSNPCPIPYPGFSEWPTAIRSNANRANNVVFKNTFFACTNGVNAIRATRNIITSNQFPNTPGSANLANIHWNIMVFDGPDASTGLIELNSIYFGRAGVQVQGNRTSTILIRGNKIQNTRLGVVSWRNPRSNISTVSNAINATPLTPTVINLPWNGIHYDELGFNSAVIRGNTIGAKTTGVFMTGISGPTGSQNFQVRRNKISMTTNPFVLNNSFVWGENYGIRAISLDQPIMSWNQIDGPHLYSSNTVSNSLLGIEVDNNTNPRIYCNTIQEAKDGIVITRPNTPGEVRRNVLNPGRTAIWGRTGGAMGAQMSWPPTGGMWHSSDNEFNCPFTLSVLRADGAPFFNQIYWIYNPVLTHTFDPNNASCINTSTNSISSSAGPPFGNCQFGWPCVIPIPINQPIAYITDYSPDFCNFSTTPAKTSEENDDDGSLEEFPEYTVSDTWVSQMHGILDTLMDSLDNPIQKYYLELNLYRYLERQDSLLQVDTLLENWFSNSERDEFVRLREIENYLADGVYDSALSALNIWNPETEQELAYKTVYSVTARLGTDTVNVLTASENEQLREIALYCPDSIGPPVHLARSILLVLDTFSGLSDCEYAKLNYAEPDSLNPDSSGLPDGEILKVYPNPGDQFVTLEHLLPQGEGYAFRVVNALGQEELWIELEEGDDLYEWDTSGLQQGLYYVFLYQNGFMVEYKLLSIIH